MIWSQIRCASDFVFAGVGIFKISKGQFLKKIILVINCVCACVRTSVEDDNFPRDGGRCVYLMIFI